MLIVSARLQRPLLCQTFQSYILYEGLAILLQAAFALICPWTPCHMVCLVLRQPLCRMRRPWQLHLSRGFQREWILSEIFFLLLNQGCLVLLLYSPEKTTGCRQVQCKWEYTYSGRGGEKEEEREEEEGSQDLNNKMPHWTLAPHTNLSLEWINHADWRWWSR